MEEYVLNGRKGKMDDTAQMLAAEYRLGISFAQYSAAGLPAA